ncbi:MAG: hypothetical protein PHR06_12965 [Candidatus Cloacimonetes bacterium]|nr:hypothetical protein [Candidatus Cloacimonadota bacterium]
MIYTDLIERMIKEEKNPVNRMYLNELLIKWKKVDAYFEKEKKADFENREETSNFYVGLASIINDYLVELSNPKYNFTNTGKKGFKKSADIFKPEYINDILTLIFEKLNISELPGVSWGYQSYTIKQRILPKRICDLTEAKEYSGEESHEILSLVQGIDLQYRAIGKKKFIKYNLKLPIIIFNINSSLEEEDFILMDFYAKQAKAVYDQSKYIVITEQHPEFNNRYVNLETILSDTYIDDIIVLFGKDKKFQKIIPERLIRLDRIVRGYLCNKKAD